MPASTTVSRDKQTQRCKCECNCTTSEHSAHPVRYFNGELQYAVEDLGSSGFGSRWGHTRYYTNRLIAGGNPVNAEYGHGNNWLSEDCPRLVEHGDGSIDVARKQDDVLFFQPSGGNYLAQYGSKATLTHDTSNHLFKLTDEHGTVVAFNDFSSSDPQGLFKYEIAPGGASATTTAVTSYTDDFVGEIQRHDGLEASVRTTESFKYDYSNGRLEYVTLRRKVGAGSWTSSHNIRRAKYTYYDAQDDNGSLGDLKTAELAIWNGSSWEPTGIHYYRYYTDSLGSGYMNALKFVFGPAAFDRLSADTDVNTQGGEFVAEDEYVAPFADLYFEYDSATQRVTKERIRGINPQSGAAVGSSTFTFSTPPTGTTYEDYNKWSQKTEELQPDDSKIVVYTNYVGQVLLRAHHKADETILHIDSQKIGAGDGDEADEAHVVERSSGAGISGYTINLDEFNEPDGTISLSYSDSTKVVTRIFTYYSADSSGIDVNTEGGPTPGGAKGYVEYEKIRVGNSGTPIALRKYEYFKRSYGGPTVYPVARETVYKTESQSSPEPIVTEYAYAWHSPVHIRQRVTKLPVVPTGQNGPGGDPVTRTEVFDIYGNLTWLKDERGFITRHYYDIIRGVVTQSIEDVDTSQITNETPPWESLSGDRRHLITDFTYDAEARLVKTLGPVHDVDGENVRHASWTVYKDGIDQVWTAQGYFLVDAEMDSYVLVNPVSIQIHDADGRVLESIAATRGSGVESIGELVATNSFARASYVRWSTNQYGKNGVLVSSRLYHAIPSADEGDIDTNYSQTSFGYDSEGRQNMVKSPGGTITRTVFDKLGRAIITYVGTGDAGATDADPTGNNATGNNMRIIEVRAYYAPNVQHGNLMEVHRRVDADSAHDRVTSYQYDSRGRLLHAVAEDAQGSGRDIITVYAYDNLDRTLAVEQFHTVATTDNLLAKSETFHDDQGRVWQTKTWPVAGGTVGQYALVGQTWYDAAGNVVKQQPPGAKTFTKTMYDGLGRAFRVYVGYDTSETSYADALTLAGDTIFEQVEHLFDDAGNLILATARRRLHDATGTGELTSPGGSQPVARVGYVAFWYDAAGRQTAVADYGTNGGSSFNRLSQTTVPQRSNTVLVSSTAYNPDGEADASTDPAGTVARQEFDDAGRRTKSIENYLAPGTITADENRTTTFAYNSDGLVTALVAKQISSADDQTTRYVYGSAAGGITPAVYRNDLLRAVLYPDSDDTYSGGYTGTLGDGTDATYDRVEYEYNRQGQAVKVKDQNGTVHEFDYDKAGRRTVDRVATLGSGVNVDVRRIELTYEDRGPLAKATSYSTTSGTSGVVNQVELAYNGFGQLQYDKQSHGAAVGTSTPKVEYAYADGSANHVRPTRAVYPDGRKLHFTYGSSASAADKLSRVDALADDNAGNPGTHLAEYTYFGLGGVVKVDYTEPDLLYTLAGGTGSDPYDGEGSATGGLDRFGRVVNLLWRDYGASADAERVKHGYDRASSRLWRECPVPAALSPAKYFDELYGYDDLYQLQTFARGDLSANKDAIASGTKKLVQDWTLDPLGNWTSFKQDTDGDGTWDLDQPRTHNKANEIGTIGANDGLDWADPAYDRAGNMTTMPGAGNPTVAWHCKYDAWNRLVQVTDEHSDRVAEFFYDGLGRRIYSKTFIDDETDKVRHYYYSAAWQVLEERLANSATTDPATLDPDRQFVWGVRYIDDLILRDRDASSEPDGILEERLYAIQDPNWNVTAIADASGAIIERYAYTAYGQPIELSPTFTPQSDTKKWETRYASYRWDNETSLYHVRNRAYHAQLGRWLQRDLPRDAGGVSLYAYSVNGPLGHVDPLGLREVVIDIILSPTNLPASLRLTSVEADLQERVDDGLKLLADYDKCHTVKVEVSCLHGDKPKRLGFVMDSKGRVIRYRHYVTWNKAKNVKIAVVSSTGIGIFYNDNATKVNYNVVDDQFRGSGAPVTNWNIVWGNILAHEVLYLGLSNKRDPLIFSHEHTIDSPRPSIFRKTTLNPQQARTIAQQLDVLHHITTPFEQAIKHPGP